MAGSTYGTLFKITTWGESHGPAVGVVIDGCPSGLSLSPEDIQTYLDRRRPGQSRYATPRQELDQIELLSGVFEGKTTGTPISLMVRNENQKSKDYGDIKECYRPGHADYTFYSKYGLRDYRGGGRSSGRETIGRVASGAVAAKLLNALGIHINTYTKSIGPVTIPDSEYHYDDIPLNALYMPNNKYADQAAEYLDSCMKSQDSSGGIIECIVTGLPVGIGETVFEKLDANLAKAIMSIGAVKGVEIGDGFSVSLSTGSQNNDEFEVCKGSAVKTSNHSGGTLGGMSDGSPLILRAAVKPTPSISRPQKTVDILNHDRALQVFGRHDPVIVPRAVVVVEAMAALTLIDMMMINMSCNITNIKDFYS